MRAVYGLVGWFGEALVVVAALVILLAAAAVTL